MTNTTDLQQAYAHLGDLYTELDHLDMDAERLDDMDNPVSSTACRTRRDAILAEIDRVAATAGIDLNDQP